jgi:hypothetical protein
MTSRWIGWLIAACLLASSVVPADAQIGGFMKKKVKEAVQAPVQQQQAQQQADEAAARALEAPDIVPITQESTARFKKALNVEIRLRGEFRSMLASMKSKEDYDACKAEFAISDMELAMSAMAAAGEKATPADLQKAMVKARADLDAKVTKRCGGDPSAWPDYERAERLRAIEAEASDAFAPTGSPEAVAAGESTTHGPAWISTDDDAPGDAHPYLRKYAIAKERWIPFCSAEAAKTEGKYRRIKGQGSVYVYSVEEAQVLSEHCPEVMATLNKTTEPLQSGK